MLKNRFATQVNKDLKKFNFMDSTINHKSLDKLGFFVLKKAFKKKTIENYTSVFFHNKKKKNN